MVLRTRSSLRRRGISSDRRCKATAEAAEIAEQRFLRVLRVLRGCFSYSTVLHLRPFEWSDQKRGRWR
jgi:hypothetical protein